MAELNKYPVRGAEAVKRAAEEIVRRRRKMLLDLAASGVTEEEVKQ